MSNYRNGWTLRAQEEARVSPSSFFLTLTYNDENIPRIDDEHFTVNKRDVNLFLKRLRRNIDRVNNSKTIESDFMKFKYIQVSEYGSDPTTGIPRPHYHFLIFLNKILTRGEFGLFCERSWQKGFVTVRPICDGNIHYVTGYILNLADVPEGCEKPFCGMSNGLGESYIDDFESYHNTIEHNLVVCKGGYRYAMPRYWRERIFNKTEQRLLSERYSFMFKDAPILTDENLDAYNQKKERIFKKHKKL